VLINILNSILKLATGALYNIGQTSVHLCLKPQLSKGLMKLGGSLGNVPQKMKKTRYISDC
jgi:hypothetical protein